jgi:imidazolonepropionase
MLIVNAEEMLTMQAETKTPRIGKQMRELGTIRDGALAIREGKILAVGKTQDITKVFRGENVVSAKGKIVMPGFVDPHTHPVFSGSREDEFQRRIEDASTTEAIDWGSGIQKTVRETHNARIERLVELGLERLDVMLAHGSTTIEAKSGYGLNTEDELKILKAIRRLNQLHCSNVVSTYMSGHTIPSEYHSNVDEYVELVLDEAIQKVSEQNLAEFCDVLCERGVFNTDQSKRILAQGKKLGLKPKIHADCTSALGGAEIAAASGATSADHLNYSPPPSINAMAQKGTIAVLLPMATFSRMSNKFPDARLMVDSGVPVALASGFNSNCCVQNQQLTIAMACHFTRLIPAEAITAATINAAFAVCRENEVGSLEVGKRADIIVLNVPNHKFLGYSVGVNLVEKVICNGRLVIDREKQDEPVFLDKAE